MAHKLNNLSLGSSSAITSYQDAPRDVTLSLAVTAAERRQLQEMAHHAGRVSEVPRPSGGVIVRDESPNGENLVYLVPDTTAATLVDEGWFAWADQPTDDFRGSTAIARMQASLKRIAARHNARGVTRGVTEFLANDFTVTDAKILQPLPPGAVNPTKSDGTRPSVILQVPAGESLLSNGGFETDATGWTTPNGGALARDAGGAKVGSWGALATRGAGGVVVAYASATVVPGVTYAYGGWLKNATATSIYIEMQYYDAAGAAISAGYTVGTAVTGTTFAYTRITAAAPPNAATVRCYISISGSAGQTGYADALTLQACVTVVESPTTEPTPQGGTALATLDYPIDGRALGPGDVKVFDMGALSDAALAESSYTPVHSPRHVFSGDVLLDNGIARLHFRKGHSAIGAFGVYAYVNGQWTREGGNQAFLDIGGGATTAQTVNLLTVSRSLVSCNIVLSDGNSAKFTLLRGTPAIRMDLARVNDSGGGGVERFSWDSYHRFAVYNESTPSRDNGIASAGDTDVAAASITEPAFWGIDPAKAFLAGIGMARKPTVFRASSSGAGSGNLNWRLTSAGTTGTERTLWLIVIPWPWLTNGCFFKEAESATLSGGAASVADASASGGNAARLDAASERVDTAAVAGRDLPLGDYTLVLRMKDSAAVASDARMFVFNNTEAAYIASANKTLTGSFAYYTLDFSLTSSHEGDTLTLGCLKETATANNIDIDYFLIVPRKRNSATPVHVPFPRDLARAALMATSSRDTIIEA